MKKREKVAYKQFKKEVKEEKKKEAERKEAFDTLSSYEQRFVEDPHYYHPRKIKKRKAEEETKFDLDTFARDVRHSKREKEKVKALVEEIAKKTDLPENKIHSVIAKVHKANKAAVEKAKPPVELPAEDPKTESRKRRNRE